MNSLLKVFKILTPSQLKKSYLIFFFMVFCAFLESFGIGLILPLISLMENSDFLIEYPEIASVAFGLGINNHSELIIVLTLCLLLFFLIKNIFIGIQYKMQINFAMNLHSFFTNKLLEFYLKKPYEYFLKTNPAEVQRNILESTRNVFLNILIPTYQFFTEIITASAIGVMLFFVDPYTSILLISFMMVLLLILVKIFRKSISKQGLNQARYLKEMYKWTNQAIGAVKETKVLGREAFFLNSFKEACAVYNTSISSYQFISQLPRLFIESICIVALLGLVVVKLLIGENISDIVPLMGLLCLSAFRLIPSANRIIATYNGIKFQLPNLELIFDDLQRITRNHLTSQTSNSEHNFKKMFFSECIEVKDVEYMYPSDHLTSNNEKTVLQGINLTIPKGKFVGIIGKSGAGKTTFVDILLGLLHPTGGSIYVDGIDIQTNIKGWQANISYVPQSIYLIDGSIKENIALGQKIDNIDLNRVNKAIEMAELSELIDNMPNGIETSVGDRGIRLSGGQKQRIGIARALYSNPDILILDEATSALDSNTEKRIMDTILKLKGKITIISIAHRVSTLDECDYKVQFENGKSKIVR